MLVFIRFISLVNKVLTLIFTNIDLNELKEYLSEDRWEPFSICEGDDSLNYINLQENGSRL